MKIVNKFLQEEISQKLRERGEEILSYFRDGYFKRGIVTAANYVYKSRLDECSDGCQEEESPKACIYRCQAEAAQAALDTLEGTISPVINNLEDSNQKEKQKRLLEDEISKYQSKLQSSEEKAQAFE